MHVLSVLVVVGGLASCQAFTVNERLAENTSYVDLTTNDTADSKTESVNIFSSLDTGYLGSGDSIEMPNVIMDGDSVIFTIENSILSIVGGEPFVDTGKHRQSNVEGEEEGKGENADSLSMDRNSNFEQELTTLKEKLLSTYIPKINIINTDSEIKTEVINTKHYKTEETKRSIILADEISDTVDKVILTPSAVIEDITEDVKITTATNATSKEENVQPTLTVSVPAISLVNPVVALLLVTEKLNVNLDYVEMEETEDIPDFSSYESMEISSDVETDTTILMATTKVIHIETESNTEKIAAGECEEVTTSSEVSKETATEEGDYESTETNSSNKVLMSVSGENTDLTSSTPDETTVSSVVSPCNYLDRFDCPLSNETIKKRPGEAFADKIIEILGQLSNNTQEWTLYNSCTRSTPLTWALVTKAVLDKIHWSQQDSLQTKVKNTFEKFPMVELFAKFKHNLVKDIKYLTIVPLQVTRLIDRVTSYKDVLYTIEKGFDKEDELDDFGSQIEKTPNNKLDNIENEENHKKGIDQILNTSKDDQGEKGHESGDAVIDGCRCFCNKRPAEICAEATNIQESIMSIAIKREKSGKKFRADITRNSRIDHKQLEVSSETQNKTEIPESTVVSFSTGILMTTIDAQAAKTIMPCTAETPCKADAFNSSETPNTTEIFSTTEKFSTIETPGKTEIPKATEMSKTIEVPKAAEIYNTSITPITTETPIITDTQANTLKENITLDGIGIVTYAENVQYNGKSSEVTEGNVSNLMMVSKFVNAHEDFVIAHRDFVNAHEDFINAHEDFVRTREDDILESDPVLAQKALKSAIKNQTSTTEKTFVVFPKKTYKTVSVYVDDASLSSREERSIVDTLPIVPEKTVQERKANETLKLRVERVIQFEMKLAEIGYENLSSAGLIGTMIQRLLLTRNKNFEPIKMTTFTHKLDSFLLKAEESVLSDYILLNTIVNAGANLIKLSDQSSSSFCADIVYHGFHETFQTQILLPVLTKDSVLSSQVLDLILKDNWVPKTALDALKNFHQAFETENRSKSDLKLETNFIDMLLDLDLMKPNNNVYYDLLVNVIQTNKNNLMEVSLFLENIQTILKIFLSIIQFETEKQQFEEAIELFNRDKNLNVTELSFVVDASFFLSLSFANQMPGSESDKHKTLASFITRNCYQSMDMERVDHMVERAFQC